VLGQLSAIIAMNQQLKTQKLSLSEKNSSQSQRPTQLSHLQIHGTVSTDRFGSICLCAVAAAASTPSSSSQTMISIKSFLLDAKAEQMLQQEISNSKEAASLIESTSTTQSTPFIPLLLSSFRTLNGFHLIYDTAIVTSLESFYQTDGSHISALPYVIANILNGLEFLHSIGIVYRAIQPEAIHITTTGRVVLMDYSICKIGGVGRETFTLCGVPDYLSPEQVSQQGHNEAVDFWSLGVLLYELTTHTNPFSHENTGELAIFSKITSYGTPSFSSLPFPSIFTTSLSSVIQQLLNPSPMKRLGVGVNGFTELKQHNYFSTIPSFDSQALVSVSPIQVMAREMEEFILTEGGGVSELVNSWNKPIEGTEYIDELLKE
jgi:protein kinase A